MARTRHRSRRTPISPRIPPSFRPDVGSPYPLRHPQRCHPDRGLQSERRDLLSCVAPARAWLAIAPYPRLTPWANFDSPCGLDYALISVHRYVDYLYQRHCHPERAGRRLCDRESKDPCHMPKDLPFRSQRFDSHRVASVEALGFSPATTRLDCFRALARESVAGAKAPTLAVLFRRAEARRFHRSTFNEGIIPSPFSLTPPVPRRARAASSVR